MNLQGDQVNILRTCLLLVVLVLAGTAVFPLRKFLRSDMTNDTPLSSVAGFYPQPKQEAAEASDSNANPLGPVALWAVLGGFRTVLADLVWIQTYRAWERRALAEVWQGIEWTLDLHPENLFFWIQSARMVGYDFPRWEVDPRRPAGFRRFPNLEAARKHYGKEALKLLGEAARLHPQHPGPPLEAALLQRHLLGNLDAAAALFKRAATLPGAPVFAAIAHGETLILLGRSQEAIRWFETLLQVLPAKAYSSEVAAIREILQELN